MSAGYSLKEELAKETSMLRTTLRVAESQKSSMQVTVSAQTLSALDLAASSSGLNRSSVAELLCRNAHRFVFLTALKAGEQFSSEEFTIIPAGQRSGEKKIVTFSVSKTAKLIVEARAKELDVTHGQLIELMAAGLPRLSLADLVSSDPLDHPDLSEVQENEDDDDGDQTTI